MKDLTEIMHLIEAQRDYYADKARKIHAKGSEATSEEIKLQDFYIGKVAGFCDVIIMIRERIYEVFGESLLLRQSLRIRRGNQDD